MSDARDDEKGRTFADFDGYESDEETDVTTDHDAWNVGE